MKRTILWIILISLAFTPVSARLVTSISLNGSPSNGSIGVADLNADGKFDYITKTPASSVDPYYWKASTTTFKINAYTNAGTHLWQYDMGWGIEQGVWFSPVVVYDLDKNGSAEVYAKWSGGDSRNGKVESDNEWVLQLDGKTGKEIRRAPWPRRRNDYNNDSRNMMCIAYLDGINPSLIVFRGTYSTLQMIAYDERLQKKWEWCSLDEREQAYRSQASHGVRAADVDNDGRDEIVIGCAVVDEYGKGLWSASFDTTANGTVLSYPKGHVDVCHVGDILWSNPGLEIFLAWEGHGVPWDFRKGNDVALYDAATGRVLWGNGSERVTHVHSTGYCGDLLPTPGLEMYCREKDGSNTWFYTADGKRHDQNYGLSGNAPRATAWDTDSLEEMCGTNGVPEGLMIDIMGDWREEVLEISGGQLKIHTPDGSATVSRPNQYQDRQYRAQLATGNGMSGYYYPSLGGRVVGKELQPTSGITLRTTNASITFHPTFQRFDILGRRLRTHASTIILNRTTTKTRTRKSVLISPR